LSLSPSAAFAVQVLAEISMSKIIKFPRSALPPSKTSPAKASGSLRYRLRASQLGRIADAQTDEARMLSLVQQALSWIQLAENEEFLAQADRPVVLVVEDDWVQRMNVVETITLAGFEALEADNADDAIAVLETRQEITVVLTDITMPGSMDGLKLAAAIKLRWPSIRVVATSGVLKAHEVEMPEGSLFLSKPYGAEQIVDTLRQLTGA
jgi:two-component system, response regulator PdtaR